MSSSTSGIRLSKEEIKSYLETLEASGCAAGTLKSYQRYLKRLYAWLPEDKYIQKEILEAWQDFLLESGYSAASANVSVSAVNGLVQFLGHREFQIEQQPADEGIQPELTRTEYLRLLSAARMAGKERAYLLVKIFGTTGIQVSELVKVTAEAVQAGKISFPSGSVRIPEGLREELLHYIRKEGIESGPVFLTRTGKPQDRVSVTRLVGSLCRDAQVAEEKANPRCLRKLYLTTQDNIRENLTVLAEQTYDRMLEKEQTSFGWESAQA